MSDTVSKWHEMQEESSTNTANVETTYIYESPDNGRTITRRPIGSDYTAKEVIKQPNPATETRKEAYTILSLYTEESIELAAKILQGLDS